MPSERIQRRIDRLLDEVESAADSEDWQTVLRLTRQVLELDDENEDAHTFLDIANGRMKASESETTVVAVNDSKTRAVVPSTDEPPTTFSDGRYQVKEFLGEGGKKQVYLAHDELLDRDVAFALIKTEGLDDVSRTRISREAQAMGRLGSHPHIVTVFDLGEHEGQPYMVTELMGGGDVEGILEDAEDNRLSLDEAIRIAVETCRGLEFAHSKGIVHRDLKPGNVWLTGEGTAKIGDFGLAVAMDRSRLTQQGMMVGTVCYMPPEQAMGGEVSPKSDLYSLGAMLYEMVAGRPPFLGDDNIAIIGQHINTPPVAPTWHRNDCPKPLEALILRLLAKNPAERPESATDVLTALESIDLSISTPSEEESPDEAHILDSLAGGVFVGRQREMGELKAALEDALSGRGRMVTLVGEPGIGKTRTAQELVTYAGLRGVQVLWGRCYEEQGVPPYWPWVQAIRSYVHDTEPESLRSEMRAGAADIAEIVSDVKDVLPDLQPSPQLDSPEQARFRLFDSIAAFLRTASQRQPIMLVLDDLHWADTPSLMLLQFVARELSGSRLLLVGTYRDVELNRQHPLAETLGELTRERLFERVLLRGLTQADVSRFIEVTSGIVPPTTLSQAVHTQTEGNPLFVTEVVRLLVQEGELTQEHVRERESWEIRVPEGVREVIGRRLNRLSERCSETLTVASVIGREFTLEQLDRLIEDLSQDMLLDVLEEALSTRLIEELPTSVGLYQFTHALIQETLVDELSLTRRVRLHAQIADTLEELYADDLESHAAELAHHFAQAEAVLGTEKLVNYSKMAGERALANHAWEDALAHFQKGFASKEGQPIDAETAALRFGLACAQAATLDRHRIVEEVVANMTGAFDYYVEVGDVTHAVGIAESPVLWIGSESRSGLDRLISSALELVPPESIDAGRLLARQGDVQGEENGDYVGAQEAFGRALAIARHERDLGLEMKTLAHSTKVEFFHSNFEKCVEAGLRVIELAHHNEDPRSELEARYYIGAALSFHNGDLAGASLHITAMLELAERLRDRQWLTAALNMKSVLCLLEGDWEGIRDYTDRGLALIEDDTRLLVARARSEYQIGNFGQGETYLERLVEVTSSVPSPAGNQVARAAMAIPFTCRIAGVVERFDFAEAIARNSLSSPSANEYDIQCARASLALMAVERGDIGVVREQYDPLVSLSGTLLEGGTMCTDRVLGLLCHAMARLDQSITHFEDALAFCRKAGYRPELAWSLCDYADMLLEREDDADRGKAMTLLDESLAISTELGMRPLMERVLSRREILKA